MTSENILSGLHQPEDACTGVHLSGQWKTLGLPNVKSRDSAPAPGELVKGALATLVFISLLVLEKSHSSGIS